MESAVYWISAAMVPLKMRGQAMTDNQKMLIRAEIDAEYDRDNPARSSHINGHHIRVTYVSVDRKCYDHTRTPTRIYYVDGQRVSRKTALKKAE